MDSSIDVKEKRMEDCSEEMLLARKKAMSLLRHMDRTEWQLRDRLLGGGFSEGAVDDAIAYVMSFHYLDDQRYAIRFVETHQGKRSLQRIRQDLLQRHVPEGCIAAALESAGGDDSAALRETLRKLTKGKKDLSWEEKRKVAGKLYRRGFREEDIRRELGLDQE